MLEGLRVLVVDDDVDSCELIASILESYAVQVQTTFSVSQALEAFVCFQPDILVSDIAMPEEDGYSLIRQVRMLEADQEPNKAVPAIAITALIDDEEPKVLSAGFHKFLCKPVDLDDLMAAIVSLTGSDTKSVA